MNQDNPAWSLREIAYAVFYLMCFLLAIVTGITKGFRDSHTPPMPFVVEFLTILIGIVIFVIDLVMRKTIKVHIIGLLLNALVMAYVFLLYFKLI